MRMFSEAKFKSLKKASQHKKIAELLKELYFNYDEKLFSYIQCLENWVGIEPLAHSDLESISNAFHRHLQKTGIGISEHSLLIKDQDQAEPKKDWLDAVIYLDHLRSAQNIGNILRTIEAFRLGRVCFSSGMADLNHPAVQKTSMGAYSHIEVVSPCIESLPKPLIAVETHRNATPLENFSFPKEFTLILGNEEFGVSHSLLEKADIILEIPLVGCKNSLNVSTCFGILGWHMRNSANQSESKK